jgi:UDP-N-acetylglucosamine 2-epimerase (non-hydrolysing)
MRADLPSFCEIGLSYTRCSVVALRDHFHYCVPVSKHSPETSCAKILCVVGARPNLMKIAPVMRAIGMYESLETRLVHTGQHYDDAMDGQFFRGLGIRQPDFNLEVGSASHAVQTAEIMKRFEPVVDSEQPDAVLVVGDVNSTIACALVASKKGVQVIHVEAGLRSYDRTMPEEINRVLTDQISDLLFTTEPEAQDNLLREGVDANRVHYVGNVMIDTLMNSLKRAVPAKLTISTHTGAELDSYGVVTLHRPATVDDRDVFSSVLSALCEISVRLPLIFPVHPRTRARMHEFDLLARVARSNIKLIPPIGYLEMLGLTREAKCVLTDSGGLQEETTALGVPCTTLRENTERPVTITQGTNTLVGRDSAKIHAGFEDILATGGKRGRIPPLWDGRASERIAILIAQWMGHTKQVPRSSAELSRVVRSSSSIHS